MDECRLLCCLLGQCGREVRFQLKIGTTSLAESEGVIGSYKTSCEPCDFSNNFGAGHLPFLGSQPRPTGYETRTERLPVRNSHVCASLLTSGFDPAKKRARKPRVGATLTIPIERLHAPRRRRFAGAERGSRFSHLVLNISCERMRTSEHAPRCLLHFN